MTGKVRLHEVFDEGSKDAQVKKNSENMLMAAERVSHPGKLFDIENPMTSGLIITEPITWSRLKVVYSFEYDGTLR